MCVYLSSETSTSGHADGGVGTVPVAVELAGGHRVAKVAIIVLWRPLSGLALVTDTGKVLGEHLAWKVRQPQVKQGFSFLSSLVFSILFFYRALKKKEWKK